MRFLDTFLVLTEPFLILTEVILCAGAHGARPPATAFEERTTQLCGHAVGDPTENSRHRAASVVQGASCVPTADTFATPP